MSRLAPVLLYIAIVAQHYQLVSMFGFPVTIGGLLGVVLIVTFAAPQRSSVAIVSVVLLVLMTAITLLAKGEPEDAAQYPRTLALFLLAAIVMIRSAGGVKRIPLTRLAPSVLAALSTVVALSVGQVLLGATGDDALFNLFGDHQYLYQYKLSYGAAGFPRAQGLFLEPSYDAFVIGACMVFLLLCRRFMWLAIVLGVTGMAATQSAAGLVILAAMLAILSIKARFPVVVGSVAALIASAYFLGPYVFGRLDSAEEAGSSASYRLVAPLQVLTDVLSNDPFGAPLGSVGRVMGSYGIMNGSSAGTSLDNGFYVIVFYFGWVGVLALILLIFWVLRKLWFGALGRIPIIDSLGPFWLMMSLTFSGGIMLPEFAFMTGLVILAVNVSIRRQDGSFLDKDNGDFFATSPSVSGMRDVRRPGGDQPDSSVPRSS